MTDDTCDAQYGKNPDPCYLEAGHAGPHSNQWGTTWAKNDARPSTDLLRAWRDQTQATRLPQRNT